ncbi:MAG: hypothetical protein IPG50_12895 [Myxococcales bacterium]|nr:hypothetical protein [Myxococcales bacterium]
MRILTTLLLGLAMTACGSESSTTETSEDEEALSLRSLCSGAGTEDFRGIEGTFVRRGTKKADEMERLVVSQAAPATGPREATYTRTLTRSCSAPGCKDETGTMSLLPDNAAFSVSFGFRSAQQTSPEEGELYFVLGAARGSNGTDITELCVARVVTAQDVRRPFAMKRVVPSP